MSDKRRTRKSPRLWLKKNSEDLSVWIGFGSILIGSYFVNPSLPWFVFGAECLIWAFLLAWSKRK